jgi:hypothetical protein
MKIPTITVEFFQEHMEEVIDKVAKGKTYLLKDGDKFYFIIPYNDYQKREKEIKRLKRVVKGG